MSLKSHWEHIYQTKDTTQVSWYQEHSLKSLQLIVENISPGWRAKESYHILGSDEFVEVFELAAPDKDFEVYSETRLQRVRLE